SMAKLSLTRLEAFVLGFETTAFRVGIDVHKKSYSLALLREDGACLTWTGPAKAETLLEPVRRFGLCITAVVYEAGPTGFTLARRLEAAGHRVKVVAPSRVPRPVRAGAKCDRLDGIKLAAYADDCRVRPIAVPSESEEAARSLLRRRHALANGRRRCKQRIKAHLLYLGVSAPEGLDHWSQAAVGSLRGLDLDPSARLTLESLLRELDFHKEELRRVEGQLVELLASGAQHERLGHLRSVPGVGFLTAASYMLEVFRPERFNNARQVASYLGLAPMVHHSGARKPRGKITPVGQSRLRSLLIEASWVWKSHDSYAAKLYNRFLSRMGIAQKAIVAVARRLAIILWRLSIEQRAYRRQPA
nr:IS110 family transposase [Desulfobacterales bacterium]